uniref:AT-rich interactive domain 4A n=1 Tax=Oreochromis niloticus TaxID=8128 RepID=A0A669F181_ORENI
MFVLAFQAADEPAYLTVGTDVSAKYRGAFCEAKIKTVKRMVKVKVTLKGESTSQVVQDDQVKGSLRVGSTVEVKTSEGICSEAVISKLTDASLYTVVFDDGDEKTLRRTSLCLKGERHFAESETLDQLPLTNPEHFGTPVIGKKSNRGGRRSSQAVADEDNESSSSEDEDDDRRRLNDELLGQVCSIENDEESSTWFLALVVSPSCNDELVVKKDQCLVRSFCNGVEGAQMFLSSKEIPDLWKMDMSQILDSSSSEDEDNEEEKESEEEQDDEEEKKRKRIKEEVRTPINKPPVLGYKDLNLFKLYRLVYHLGGCHKIESGTVWKQVYIDLGIPVLNSAASYNVKTAYKKYLYGFEEYCRSAAITFRTIHHNNPRPPATPASQKAAGAALTESSTPTVKVETVVDKQEEVESESESEKEDVKERQSSPRGRRRCVGSRVKAERETSSKLDKRGPGEGENREEQQREVRRRSNRRNDDSERGSDDDEEDEDDEEEEEGERRRGDSENEEDGDTVTGTKVRVKYGRGKTQKIYEAHIKKTDNDNGEQFYLVHYYGWNVRYDEWVKADRIIWPVEKATKKRQKKKTKDKDELDKEEEKPAVMAAVRPTVGKRGRPQIRTTPNSSTGRSKTSSSEGRSNCRSSRTDTSSMANGDNTPQKRTRRTSGMYDSDRASNGENTDLDKENKMSPVTKTASVQDENKMSLRQELLPEMCLSRTPPPLPPEREQQVPSSLPSSTDEDNCTTPASSPRVKGRRSNIREAGSETPPRAPLSNPSPASTASRSQRQDEPMVVLHCLPTPHLLPEASTADSDTDSATEEEEAEEMEEEAEERSSVALKRKAGDQKTAEKKPRPDRRQEETTKMVAGASPKALPLPLHSEKSSEGVVIAEEQPHPAEEPQKEVSKEHLTGGATKVPVMPSGTASLVLETQEPAYTEELEPQIDPESLVCHEVDLDDTDEKEKPIPSLDHHFPIVNESQQAPPPLPHLIHSSLPSPHTPHFPQPQARPFLPEVTPIEERDSSPGFDGSASSSSTSLSLQENKDRGQKRLTDCNSSPSAKKQKRNQKRPQTPGRVEKNGAGHSSDSEDQSRLSSLSKSQKSRPSFSSPSSHKQDKQSFSTPQRTYKWTFQLDELDSMSSTERISFLQEKLQEIRKYYMTLKSEVASIDRRRKRLKKKEREVRNSVVGTAECT